jgi:chromosome segregation ATPase
VKKPWSPAKKKHRHTGHYIGINYGRFALDDDTRTLDDETSTLDKDDVLDRTKKQLKEAQSRVTEVKHAIQSWKKYLIQHEAELPKITLAIQKLEDHERKALIRKLSLLGRESSTDDSRSSCSICLDRPK